MAVGVRIHSESSEVKLKVLFYLMGFLSDFHCR